MRYVSLWGELELEDVFSVASARIAIGGWDGSELCRALTTSSEMSMLVSAVFVDAPVVVVLEFYALSTRVAG